MIQIEFKEPYLSIKNLRNCELPDFTVLIGRNGVGKTQLLEAITRVKVQVTVSNLPISEIKMYNLGSFRPLDSNRASWGDCTSAESAVEKYFNSSVKGTSSPVVVAKNIFEEILSGFGLTEGSDNRLQFEDEFRNGISSQEGPIVFVIQGNRLDALGAYCQKIQRYVLNHIRQSSTTSTTDAEMLILRTLKLTGKFPHEICREDILRAANYEGEPIANSLSHIFARYKVEQFSWAHKEGEKSKDSFKSLMLQYRRENIPPWITLEKYLDQMREATGDTELFNFEFSDPEEDQISFTNHSMYSFESEMTNKATGDSYSTKTLSSGEKILMSLCLASFNQSIGRRQPRLVLLDELDTVLHPSMISALISGLKTLFVEKGTPVIMATHSVTTVAMVEEGEIYRVVRNNKEVELRPVTKSEAVLELSEGIATIDTGLKIASSDVAPITILTEGKNTLHLKRWASLFYPGKVEVFEDLPDKTGKDQLKAYGQLLAKMNTNSHILIVWDCDAEKTAMKLKENLRDMDNVTAFSFEKRDNTIAEKGIENKYDDFFLKPFAIESTRLGTGEVVSCSFDNGRKSEFAELIFSKGMEEHFKHFDDLCQAVDDILSELPN